MAGGSKLSPLGHAIAGTGGAMFALTCTYPLDIIKTRMQVRSKATADANDPNVYLSTTDAVQKILRTEGLAGLYAGLFSGLLGTASQNFAYFYWYTFLRSGYIQRQPAGVSISTIMELLIGAGAGALAQIFTIPVAVVTTRQQTMPLGERQNLKDTASEIVQEEGWTGLWKGLKPSLVLVINPAITYGMYSRIQELVLKTLGRKDMTPGLVFLVGALAKTLATVVTYPYIMAKVRLQWKPSKKDAETHKPYKGAIDVLQRVFAKEGFKGWYTGMQAQITKAVISQALLFMVKDQLEKYTTILFALMSRSKRAKVL
ncbi:ADP/ATP carrier protein [Lunasporangiospora selenospora]|uniref:ADP/ATP carrier protein n=1 Tax=Lunasporangiospora selenospora TaxID=979761 RepID=A0A9P6KDF9_9FUNG|nr:ADP/ATP carrier protein [Lunasporangiospora selenospora]